MSPGLRRRAGLVLRRLAPFGHRTFDLVRFDVEIAIQRLKNALSPRYRRQLRALARQRGLSLNVGSGGFGRSGWINIDARPTHRDILFTHDLRRPLPLPDGSARRIFAEHVIEHLDFRHEIPGVLRDFHRLLEAGGTLRIIVPDAGRYLQAYASRDESLWAELGWDKAHWPADLLSPMHAINHVFHQEGEHYFGYDFETMAKVLNAAGFSHVEHMAFRKSVDPELAIDRDEHAKYSLYVDAVK